VGLVHHHQMIMGKAMTFHPMVMATTEHTDGTT
jgi:hypothetical protein